MESYDFKTLDKVVKPLKYASTVITKRVAETRKHTTGERVVLPASWIKAIRKSFNIPVSVIAKGIGKSPQAIIEFEKSEAHEGGGKITIESLAKIAEAMDMELVYGFVPKHYPSLEKMINAAAWYKTQENIRKGKEDIGVSLYGSRHVYNKRKKKRAQNKVSSLPKSLWK